jgi:DNA polymerase
MDPALALDAVLAELKRQKAEGVRLVSISEESLSALRQLSAQAAPSSTPASVANLTRPASVASTVATFTPTPAVKVVPKVVANPVADTIPPPPVVTVPPGSKAEQMAWLQALIKSCPETKRHLAPNHQPVLGYGSLEAAVFFIGEAPILEEVEAGRPFVGASGELLEKILKAAAIDPDQVYFAPVMGWRPEPPTPQGKRPPTSKELAFNLPYLKAQLAIVKPKVVVTLGAHAHESLLGKGETITQARGRWTKLEGFDVMPTFHPNYLLHNPSPAAKRTVWEDFLQIMEKLGLPISEKQRAFFTDK